MPGPPANPSAATNAHGPVNRSKPPEGSRFCELERLRRPPTRTTRTAFARALERVDEIGRTGWGG
nr:hypothetical protein [Streptomyces rishiriensis]